MSAFAVFAVVVFAAALTTGCGDARSERQGTAPKQPHPEDSAMPGPLPKPAAPSTATDNPTGTGTGR
jgi:hypothetical protein